MNFHDDDDYGCCEYTFERVPPRTDKQILADARSVLRQQARQRHADLLAKLNAELKVELENIDKVLGL